MPRRTLIRSAAFSDPCDFAPSDLITLSVESIKDFSHVLFPDVNWNGGVVGCLTATLSADNEQVESATFHLLGELRVDKVINVSSFWPTTTATSLTLSHSFLLPRGFAGFELCLFYRAKLFVLSKI